MAKRGRRRKAQEPASAQPAQAAAGAEPGARSHTRANGFIALFLLFQVAMPLAYYLGGRGTDERFSWRMFSSVRMQKCRAQVTETVGSDTRPLDLDREVQIAWIGMLDRYRPAVVEKLLQRRCERADASTVRYVRRCTETDGSTAPELQVALDCASGDFTRPAPGAEGGTP